MADKRVNERCLVSYLKSTDFHLFYTYSWCVRGSVVFAIESLWFPAMRWYMIPKWFWKVSELIYVMIGLFFYMLRLIALT